MKPEYFSFLVCRHPDKTDIYVSGRPVGSIVNGTFEVYEKLTPAGNRVSITEADLPLVPDVATLQDLRVFLQCIAASIPEKL